MKHIFVSLLIMSLLMSTSCTTDDDVIEVYDPIVGRWKPVSLVWETTDNHVHDIQLTECQQISKIRFVEEHFIGFDLFPLYQENPDDCYTFISNIIGAWVFVYTNRYSVYYEYFNLDSVTHFPDYDNPQNGSFIFDVEFIGDNTMHIIEQDMLGYFTEQLPEDDVKTYYVVYEKLPEWGQ